MRKSGVIPSTVIHKFKNVSEFKKIVAKNFPEYRLIKKESAAPADKTRTSSSAGYGRQYGAISSLPE